LGTAPARAAGGPGGRPLMATEIESTAAAFRAMARREMAGRSLLYERLLARCSGHAEWIEWMEG